MTKILWNKFDKAKLAQLPTVTFGGKIVLVDSEEAANQAVDWLMQQPVLGFDTETKPCFSKGRTHTVALLQVATEEVCYLFRLCRIGMPDCIERLLCQRGGPKRVGLSWGDDSRSLNRRRKMDCAPFVELQHLSRDLGIEDCSLQKLFANVMGGRISKRQQLSNWENPELTPAQQRYAATDAWACVVMYHEMVRLMYQGDYEIKIDSDEQQADNA